MKYHKLHGEAEIVKQPRTRRASKKKFDHVEIIIDLNPWFRLKPWQENN